MFSLVDGIELSNGIIGKLGGGVPLTLRSGVSAGSIGISGAMTPGDDELIALAAAAQIDSLMGKAAAYKAASALNLAQALASNPSSKSPADPPSLRCPLIPAKLSEAPPETAMIYWERSMTLVAPGLAIDTADMVERPVMMWNADPNKLYTVIAVDEGISRLQDHGLGFLHWVVTNVPGDKVGAQFNSSPTAGVRRRRELRICASFRLHVRQRLRPDCPRVRRFPPPRHHVPCVRAAGQDQHD